MNKFIGIGNLCKDLELRQTNSGKYMLSNSIAIRNDFKNSDGEYDSEFVNIQVWGKTAEYLAQYAQKGMKVAIEGRLVTRAYDRADGTRAYSMEVVCSSVEILGNKKQQELMKESQETQEDPFAQFGETVSIDDNFLD